jgi:hypothetical protein
MMQNDKQNQLVLESNLEQLNAFEKEIDAMTDSTKKRDAKAALKAAREWVNMTYVMSGEKDAQTAQAKRLFATEQIRGSFNDEVVQSFDTTIGKLGRSGLNISEEEVMKKVDGILESTIKGGDEESERFIAKYVMANNSYETKDGRTTITSYGKELIKALQDYDSSTKYKRNDARNFFRNMGRQVRDIGDNLYYSKGPSFTPPEILDQGDSKGTKIESLLKNFMPLRKIQQDNVDKLGNFSLMRTAAATGGVGFQDDRGASAQIPGLVSWMMGDRQSDIEGNTQAGQQLTGKSTADVMNIGISKFENELKNIQDRKSRDTTITTGNAGMSDDAVKAQQERQKKKKASDAASEKELQDYLDNLFKEAFYWLYNHSNILREESDSWSYRLIDEGYYDNYKDTLCALKAHEMIRESTWIDEVRSTIRMHKNISTHRSITESPDVYGTKAFIEMYRELKEDIDFITSVEGIDYVMIREEAVSNFDSDTKLGWNIAKKVYEQNNPYHTISEKMTILSGWVNNQSVDVGSILNPLSSCIKETKNLYEYPEFLNALIDESFNQANSISEESEETKDYFKASDEASKEASSSGKKQRRQTNRARYAQNKMHETVGGRMRFSLSEFKGRKG